VFHAPRHQSAGPGQGPAYRGLQASCPHAASLRTSCRSYFPAFPEVARMNGSASGALVAFISAPFQCRVLPSSRRPRPAAQSRSTGRHTRSSRRPAGPPCTPRSSPDDVPRPRNRRRRGLVLPHPLVGDEARGRAPHAGQHRSRIAHDERPSVRREFFIRFQAGRTGRTQAAVVPEQLDGWPVTARRENIVIRRRERGGFLAQGGGTRFDEDWVFRSSAQTAVSSVWHPKLPSVPLPKSHQ